MNANISKELIDGMSYTDFIAFIKQTNVPPGSFSTLTKWRINSGIDQNSNIFESACSTGFSLLNLVRNGNCKGVGVDISRRSIETAKEIAVNMDLSDKVSFDCCDATIYQSKEKFSHIVLGAALGFFDNPSLMMKNILSMIDESAYVLASPFYGIKEMPNELVVESRRILGITPTIKNYKEIMKLYHGFDIEYEDRSESIPETEDEISHYCHSTITRACQDRNIVDNHLYKTLYDRLYEIKAVCNRLREYQRYTVLILKYNRAHYPNRYVELF